MTQGILSEFATELGYKDVSALYLPLMKIILLREVLYLNS